MMSLYKRKHINSRKKKKKKKKKKTKASLWFEKQNVLGAKGGSWRRKNVETTVYHMYMMKYKISSQLHGPAKMPQA